jgi:hypothetical protein
MQLCLAVLFLKGCVTLGGACAASCKHRGDGKYLSVFT